MEVRQVEYFTAIARHGGLRHAADELNVSPGNLSGQIKSLESELGVRLPERGSRHLTLTEAGVAFLERVEQAMLVLNTAREEMLVKLLASGEVHAACVLLTGEGDVLPAGLSAQRLMSELLVAVLSPDLRPKRRHMVARPHAAPLAVLKGNRYAAQ
jgi:DNA-binding transcriptional LysR family regulator